MTDDINGTRALIIDKTGHAVYCDGISKDSPTITIHLNHNNMVNAIDMAANVCKEDINKTGNIKLAGTLIR